MRPALSKRISGINQMVDDELYSNMGSGARKKGHECVPDHPVMQAVHGAVVVLDVFCPSIFRHGHNRRIQD